MAVAIANEEESEEVEENTQGQGLGEEVLSEENEGLFIEESQQPVVENKPADEGEMPIKEEGGGGE